MASQSAPPDDGNTKHVSDLMRHTAELIRAEVALARDELGEEARRARRGVTFLLVGTLTTQCGVLFLGVALPAALGASPLEIAVIAAVIITIGLLMTLLAWVLMTRPRFVRTRQRLVNPQTPSVEGLP
jgi:hypothetical protein